MVYGNLHDGMGIWAVALLKTQPDTIPSQFQSETYAELNSEEDLSTLERKGFHLETGLQAAEPTTSADTDRTRTVRLAVLHLNLTSGVCISSCTGSRHASLLVVVPACNSSDDGRRSANGSLNLCKTNTGLYQSKNK